MEFVIRSFPYHSLLREFDYEYRCDIWSFIGNQNFGDEFVQTRPHIGLIANPNAI